MPDILLEAFIAALDYFEAGFLAVFPGGEILHANLAAQEMMKSGWPIQSNNGCLQGCNKKTTAFLLDGLRQAAQCGERSFSDVSCLDICLASSGSPKGAAVATLKALSSMPFNPPPVALFVTCLGNRSACSLSGVAECFALTPAETRALQHFSEGGTIAEAALALSISENTVKTHLQNIFAKTRLARQSQLIKLINDFRPPLRGVSNAVAANHAPPQ